MLGTRTKQVISYGRRQQRIVSISDEREKTDPFSLLNDTTVPRAPISSRIQNRENLFSAGEIASPSPHVVKIHRKKKRLSPVPSPPPGFFIKVKKRTRVEAIIDEDKPLTTKQRPSSPLSNTSAIIDITTPSRTPLAVCPINALGSPVIMKTTKARKKSKIPGAKGTPLSLKKPFSPFVDVDIIVLDQHGRRISQERRVSRVDVQVNPNTTGTIPDAKDARRKKSLGYRGQDLGILYSDDDEAASAFQPKPAKRPRGVKAAVVISDDSETDEAHVPQIPRFSPAIERGRALLGPQRSLPRVEVIVPFKPSRTVSRPPSTNHVSAIIPDSKAAPEDRSTRPAPAPPTLPSASRWELSELQNAPARSAPAPMPQTQLQDIPSPIQRPRQLTPIRNGGVRPRRLFEPPSPPSPTTPTDFDLSLEFSKIDLGQEIMISGSGCRPTGSYIHPTPPEYLLPLLEECAQEICGPHEFSAFIEMFPLDPIVQHVDNNGGGEAMMFRKIGEASYSEVFGIGDVVLKIIPLRDESLQDKHPKGPTPTQAFNKSRPEAFKYGDASWEVNKEEEQDCPPPSDAKDVLKEVIVTRAMGEMCEGFVKLLKAYVVRGRYPEVLLDLWDEYFERKGSESIRPGTLFPCHPSWDMS
jgi:serine/threonine-protein kinase haspin